MGPTIVGCRRASMSFAIALSDEQAWAPRASTGPGLATMSTRHDDFRPPGTTTPPAALAA